MKIITSLIFLFYSALGFAATDDGSGGESEDHSNAFYQCAHLYIDLENNKPETENNKNHDDSDHQAANEPFWQCIHEFN